MGRYTQVIREWGLTLLLFACFIAIVVGGMVLIGGCDSLRMAPTEPQKQIAYQAVITARAVKNEGTDPDSPAATQLVDATQVSLAYTGVPATPTITDYPTTLAQAGQDAARRPTADEVWIAADGWIDLAIAIAGLFGGTAGIAATHFLVKASQKSRALREVVSGNEKLKEWLRLRGKTLELDTFYDMQNAEQNGRTEEIVAAERARLKPPPVPNMPSNVKPPAPSMN